MGKKLPTPHALQRAAGILGRMGGTIGGRSRSPAKAAAARANGVLGGRPRKKKGQAA